MDIEYRKFKWKDAISSLGVPLLAIAFAMLIGAILMLVMGMPVGTAYSALIKGSLGSGSALAETIVKSTPLIFTALSYALAKRCGMVNLGAEGQLYMGGLFAALVGLYVQLPMPLHILLCTIAGFIGGGLWGMLASALKIRFGASEMITTIMLNYIANFFINYMVINVITEPGDLPQSAKMYETAQLPHIAGSRVHIGFFIALLCIVIYYLFLWKTKSGFETRVVGLNAEAARYAGFSGNKRSLMAMFMAGGFAGLAGMVEILGIQIRVYPNFSPGYGFDGIAAALLGRNSPIGIFLSSFLFGILRAGSAKMELYANTPLALIYVIQAFVIMFVVGSVYFEKVHKKNEIKRRAKEDQ